MGEMLQQYSCALGFICDRKKYQQAVPTPLPGKALVEDTVYMSLIIL